MFKIMRQNKDSVGHASDDVIVCIGTVATAEQAKKDIDKLVKRDPTRKRVTYTIVPAE